MAGRRRTILRDGADPIDQYVGARLRERRVWQKLSQSDLAQIIGVTYQQAQKYENGTNRVSASTLWKFAKALGVDVPYFFENLPKTTIRIEAATKELSKATEAGSAVKFAREVMRIPDKGTRDAIMLLMRKLAR